MASQFIGAIVGANTGQVYAVVNPDRDDELDNPQLLLLRGEQLEPMRMVKIPREEYQGLGSLAQVSEIVRRLTP